MEMGRRDFLRISAVVSAAAATGAAPLSVERRNGMPYRVLGKTGEKVSLLGVGGAHIGQSSLSDDEAVRLIRTAIDAGVNFMDNAYIYSHGNSETRMGKALRDGYREKVFLMTKQYSDERDPESARRQLEESLQRLQTDVIDLWQIHQIHRAHHAKAVYESGILDVFTKAREEGKIRYIGFTGHTRPEYHLEMIERGFGWDTVQMPTNAFDHHWVSFTVEVLPKALEKGLGIIGMKSLGGSPGQIPNQSKALTAEDAIRYAMNLPIATLVSGMDSMDVLEKNLAIARNFRPLGEEEVADLLARSRTAAQGGRFEPYKNKTV
jgi:uncharacterized protein